VDYALPGRLPGRSDGASRRDRDRAGPPASAGARLQTAHLEPRTQIERPGGLGKKGKSSSDHLESRAGWASSSDGGAVQPVAA
jgi:hypothetical protein